MINQIKQTTESDTLNCAPMYYTAQEIGQQHNVSESSVRKRWFDWLAKVAPVELLKTTNGYTELAHTLFAEFANVDKRERVAWVEDAKRRYSQEWASAGVIEGELMPDEVGSVLAIMSNQNDELSQQIQLDTLSLEGFIDELNAADLNVSQAEIKQYQAAGVKRALIQFKTEETAKAQALNALRKKRLEGQNQ